MTAAPDTRGAAAPVVDVMVESPLWAGADVEATVRGAIAQAAAQVLPQTLPSRHRDAEVAVVLADDAAVRALNRRWRGIDAPTNVLSFPAGPAATGAAPALLGDIVIAYETVAREAAAEGKSLTDHLAHLTVHGFLHLLGYDHESDDAAEAMEGLERTILARLDVADPYGARLAGSDVDRHG